MADAEDFDGGVILARITITRVLVEDDLVDHIVAVDTDGSEMGLADALGMMRLAEDTLIRARMGDGDGD